jgi:hypothetical protein
LTEATAEWSIVDGSWDTSRAQLQRFASFKSHKLSYQKIFEAIRAYSHELVLPALEAPSFESIFDLKIKWRAEAGFDYAPSKKGEAWSEAYKDARILWGIFTREYYPACFEWMVGGRWRRNKSPHDDNAESRAVLYNVFSMDLITMLFSQPLTNAFKKLDGGFNFLGHSMQKLGYERYVRWKNEEIMCPDGTTAEPNIFIAIDAKSHDSSRTRKHKVIVLSLIRACFPKSGLVDRVFFAITYNLCNLKVVTPGGFTYLLQDGNPSGTPLTSWISTLSNWIDWCCIRHFCPHLRRRDGSKYPMEVIIAGDDTEVKASIPEGETVKWHLVARWAKKHCSLDIPIEEWCFDEFDDTADDLVNQCDKEKVSFLKVSVTGGQGGTHQMKHFANKDLAPKTILRGKKFCSVGNLRALMNVHCDSSEMRQVLALRYFQLMNGRDPGTQKGDKQEMRNYRRIVVKKNNVANRSYTLAKFFSRYHQEPHAGEPFSKNYPELGNMRHRGEVLRRRYGFKRNSVERAVTKSLPLEFSGLPFRPEGKIIRADGAHAPLKGRGALPFPLSDPRTRPSVRSQRGPSLGQKKQDGRSLY